MNRTFKINVLHRSTLYAFWILLISVGTASAETAWVADLDISKTQQDWGTPQKNRAVGGGELTLAGVKYEHGLGTHANSELRINLAAAAIRFTATVGFDAETEAEPAAAVIFKVVGDGKTLWTSDVMRVRQQPVKVDVDLSGIKTIRLLVHAADESIRATHVDWADAKIEYAGQPPVTVEAPVSLPEILTPPPPPAPRINGARVFGVRPGSPILYTIPATGDRPMTFAAEGLPPGVSIDTATGRMGGTVAATGEHVITLRATNAVGTTERKWKLIVGDTIALTPPLGWNSWNCWGEEVDQEKVLRSARAIVASGLVNHGWTYINIDDTWQGRRGGVANAIQPDPKRFPDMKALCDSVHAMGLKVGIYSSPWIETYGGRIGGSADDAAGDWTRSDRRAQRNWHVKPYDVGRYSFAKNDAKQWATWGIDYLKYDWGPVDVKNAAEMNDALRASGRDVVYSLSNNAAGNILGIINDLSPTANAWRTTGDINDSWGSMSGIGFNQDKWASAQRPGHYNDTDMLVVGQVGWGHPHPTKLTPDEQYTHISLWSLLGSPMLIGCDLEKLDPFTISLLSNDEVLAVNQDELCKPATCVVKNGDVRVYVKPLADGSVAVGLFNLAREEKLITVSLATLGRDGKQNLRDLWRQKDLSAINQNLQATVQPHGVFLVKLFQ